MSSGGTVFLPVSSADRQRREAEEVFYNSYKCRQLYTLIDSRNFNPSLTWLSRRIKVEEKDLSVFLDALLTLNLIERTSQGFSALPLPDMKIKKIQPQEHAALTQDLLGEFLDFSSDSLFFCVATEEALRADFMDQLKKLIKSFCFQSRGSARNLIYSVSLSATKIKEGDPL